MIGDKNASIIGSIFLIKCYLDISFFLVIKQNFIFKSNKMGMVKITIPLIIFYTFNYLYLSPN